MARSTIFIPHKKIMVLEALDVLLKHTFKNWEGLASVKFFLGSNAALALRDALAEDNFGATMLCSDGREETIPGGHWRTDRWQIALQDRPSYLYVASGRLFMSVPIDYSRYVCALLPRHAFLDWAERTYPGLANPWFSNKRPPLGHLPSTSDVSGKVIVQAGEPRSRPKPGPRPTKMLQLIDAMVADYAGRPEDLNNEKGVVMKAQYLSMFKGMLSENTARAARATALQRLNFKTDEKF